MASLSGFDGQEIFVSHAWRRLFEIRAPLVQEFILEFFNTCRIGLHTAEEMAEDRFRAYWLGSKRVIPDKGDLSDYWVKISSSKDFLRGAPSYTYIKDLVRRLCYKLISYNISGRGRHLKSTCLGTLREGIAVSGYLEDILLGVLLITLVWTKEAPDAASGALGAAEDSLVVDEGAQANLAPEQAPQPAPPPLVTGMTMAQRLGRLEEEMQGSWRIVSRLIRHSMGPFKGAHHQYSRDALDRGPEMPAPLQLPSSQIHDIYPLSSYFYMYIYY
ncbi:hypothetical protein Tco_1338173 [Tanacetum coccineum]